MASESILEYSNAEKAPVPMDKNITILNLGHEKYLFKSPFPVNITIEDGVYIAASYDLNTFGYGETEDEALRDLCEGIIEHYEHLKAEQDNFGPLLKRDWDFLSRMIIEMEIVECN